MSLLLVCVANLLTIAFLYCFAFLSTNPSIHLNVTESWFSVDEKDPVAYAKIVVVEASDMKPSDLNGYPFLCDDSLTVSNMCT